MSTSRNDISDFLSRLGLTDTEISLYITALQFGPQTAAELAKRSGIKRTTAQSALSSLLEKGMVGVHFQSDTSHYTAIDPHLIDRQFIEQIDALKKQQLDFINLLPLFEDIADQSATATEVASYQGISGVKTAVDAALFCVSRQWKIIAPEHNFFSEGDKEYSDYFIRIRKQREIKAKSLWESGFVAKRTFDATAFAFRNPRVLPKNMTGKFKSTIIIFDSSIVFVSSAWETSAILIKSAEINQTMEVFFDGLWANAKKIPKRNTST